MELPNILGGEEVKGSRAVEVRNPYDETVVGMVFPLDKVHIEMILRDAVSGFSKAKELSTGERAAILEGISRRIQERSDELARIITLEAGKPIRDSRTEVSRAAFNFNLASEYIKHRRDEVIPLDLLPITKGRIGIQRRFPLGPVLGISPFNFPLNLVGHKIAPAIAAGDSIVLKPASKTPLSALTLAKIALESGALQGIVNVVTMNGSDAEALVSREEFKLLSFTGSDEVGWRLKSIAGKKRVLLELGGNAAVIVEPDLPDMDYAVDRITYGSFAYAGQICISVQRIYVHKNIYDNFLTKFIAKTECLRMGDPMDETTDLPPLVDESSAARVWNWIQKARESHAQILTGGKRDGNFISPTILTDCDESLEVVSCEAFGPIVVVESHSDLDEAISRTNRSRFGLQAGLFTSDMRKIMKAHREIEVGGLIINDVPTFRMDNMPYGGVKDSGIGREGIAYAYEEYTEPKLLVIAP